MKKIISLIIALTMLLAAAFSLGGCTGKKLKVAFDGSVPQLFSQNKKGEYSGINYEIASAVAEKLKMELKPVSVSAEDIEKGVKSGNYALGLGTFSSSDVPAGITLSDVYYNCELGVVKRTDSGYETFAELQGGKYGTVKVGVLKGTAAEWFAKLPIKNGGFGEENVTVYDSRDMLWYGLSAQNVNIVVADAQAAFSIVTAKDEFSFFPDSEMDFGLSAYISEKDGKLSSKISDAFSELMKDGTIAEIVERNTK